MEIVKQPDFQVFASEAKTGEVLKFPDILRGWGITLEQTQGKPPLEWMNDAFNRIDLNNLYNLQQGIPEWHKSIRYPESAVVKNNGKIYICLVENENNEPHLNSDKWTLYVKKASEKEAGIVQLNAAIDESTTKAPHSKAVKTYVDQKFDNIKIPEYEKTKILQELGDQTDATISQKAITDEFTKVGDEMDNIRFDYVKNYVDEKIKESRVEQRLIKKDLSSPCFIKKNANTVAIKAGTAIVLKNGEIARYDNDETVKLEGSHVRGSDYAIYADRTGTLHAVVDNFENPAIIPGDAVLVGGYHYSLIPENETIESGEFATTGSGMIWTQADVDRIRGINEFSLWDIRFRAGGIIASPLSQRFGQLSNHGMAFDRATNRWYAMFHVSSDVDKFGISRAGTDIASGTVLPVIPSAFNGNGVEKYDNLNWWTANELVASQGARLLYEFEFNSRAFGVTENKVAGGSSSTYPKTERIKGLTSKIGCEQVAGVQYYWGLESSYRSDAGSWEWRDVTGGRGNYYIQGPYAVVKSLFGGNRTNAPADVGSRCVYWNSYPWHSYWNIGAVATRDLLIL